MKTIPFFLDRITALYHSSLRAVFLAGFLTGILCPGGWTEQVTLYWQPNTGISPQGYNVYCRLASGPYQKVKDAGDLTYATITNLEQGKTYYFAVKAYNVYGKESRFSDEIAYTVPVPVTPSPTNQPIEAPTATATFTPTLTSTPKPVLTPTSTPTNTPTSTPTNKPTNTPTITPTNTPTSTPTSTPTNTPRNTPTNTPTGTPTSTPTGAPRNTPTSQPTNTPTNTPMVENTPVPTATPTVTPTQPPLETPPDTQLTDELAATFETHDFSEWDKKTDKGNDLKISTSSPFSGQYCAQFVYDDTTPEYLSAAIGETTEGQIAFQLKFNLNKKYSNLSTAFLKLYAANGVELLSGEYAYQDKKIKYFSRLRTVGGWDEGTWNYLAADSNWHRLEIQFKIHDTEGYHRVLIDGHVVYEAARLSTNALGGRGAVSLSVGNISGLRTGVNNSFYLDDARVIRLAGISGQDSQNPAPVNTPTPVPAVTPTNTPKPTATNTPKPTATPTTTPTPQPAVKPTNPPDSMLVDVFDSGFEGGTFSGWDGEKDLGNDLGITSTAPNSETGDGWIA
ncbi:MAG TPA: fibronectin type III domain-containing protein, partial [bacterium]|nr:fibronectin type III domain-containing protein [bacterium]